jgi:mannosylglucosylglycerate synthase
MNIAMIHFRVGATDGVSLEMDKWKENLEKLGHHVIYIAAEENKTKAHLIKEMSIYSDKHKKFFHNCYERLDDYDSDLDLIKDINQEANLIKEKLKEIIEKESIDLIIPNNVSSLGLNLAVGIAISNLIDETKLEVIYHHHDFYWERERYASPTSSKIQDILENYFPNVKHNATHCVINQIAKKEIKERKNIDAIVVPNVFDFTQPLWKKTDYNKDLRSRLNIQEEDIVFLQATRIEDRKAIELAIDTVELFFKNLNQYIGSTLYNGKLITKQTKVFLILSGLNELRSDKFINLTNKIKQASFEIKIISDLVESKRSEDINNKTYALWDVYTMCDFVTYPSILEGWGNQFIEAIFAKKPILIYEYPVFQTDIKPLGFNVVSLGDQHTLSKNNLVTVKDDIINHAKNDIYSILLNKEKYQKTVNQNFTIAQQHLSYEKLRSILKNIISNKEKV